MPEVVPSRKSEVRALWGGLMRTPVYTTADNRMLRIGGGRHDGRWFFRIDLWWWGWRWTRS